MTTTTMNAMTGSLAAHRSVRNPRLAQLSLATAKFLQQRAALPEMPEQETHATAFAGIALRLVAAAVPVGGLAWLAVAG
jgi:hypothetical protein